MGPWWAWGLVLAPGRWGQVLGCMIAGLWVRGLVLACWWVWPVPDIRCPRASVGTLVSVAQSQGRWVRGLICLRSVIHLLVGKARVPGGGRVS